MSTNCASNCYGGCTDTCKGNCFGSCKNGPADGVTDCSKNCGASDCSSSCSNCHTNCGSSCAKGCSNSCSSCGGACSSSCTGCTSGCEAKCDRGCSTAALQDLYLNLKLDELIMYDDVERLKKAIENELTRRNMTTLIKNTPFTKDNIIQYEVANNLNSYLLAMNKNTPKEIEDDLVHRNVFEAYIQAVKELYEINVVI